ncbi:DUF1896 family protein [Flavobacterium sp.]|uniref:DUF1896 family protein n=1 Tax=Flavobacterium sp. TaxID=239 RepID=UPI003A8D6D87
MVSKEKDRTYFSLRLQDLLNKKFPEKAWDSEFVNYRSRLAANAYQGARTAGNPINQCEEIADYILFEGLHFSKFETVFNVICQKFDTLMEEDELHAFAMKMLPVCLPVFANYRLSDDFATTTDFKQLCVELTKTIANWTEENGLL